jgi:hypothetical protein
VVAHSLKLAGLVALVTAATPSTDNAQVLIAARRIAAHGADDRRIHSARLRH